MLVHNSGEAGLAKVLVRLVFDLLFKAAEEALVIDAHCFKELEFKLLAVTTQLSCQSIAL